jgi:large subunit ribosomal protein L25
MSTVSITASPRQDISKGALKHLRQQGFVPGIVYGGADRMNLPVQISARELSLALERSTESAFLTLTLDDGSKHLVLPREIQYGTIKRDLRHIDLLVVERDAVVKTTIPVHIMGTNQAPLQYGLLEIEVKAKPADIPAGFEVDVTGLQMGETIYVSDLDIPAAVELISELDEMVVSVVTSSEEPADEEEAEEEATETTVAENPEETL